MYPQTWYKHITREWRKTKRKRKENWLLGKWDEQILANLTKWNIMSKKFSTFSCFWKSVDHDFFYYTFKHRTCFHHVILVLLKKELKTETIFLTKNLILDIWGGLNTCLDALIFSFGKLFYCLVNFFLDPNYNNFDI